MVDEIKVQKCLIKGCDEVSKSRGLCVHHYAIARGRVNSKKETWLQFEALGIALPSAAAATSARVGLFDNALALARSKGK